MTQFLSIGCLGRDLETTLKTGLKRQRGSPHENMPNKIDPAV